MCSSTCNDHELHFEPIDQLPEVLGSPYSAGSKCVHDERIGNLTTMKPNRISKLICWLAVGTVGWSQPAELSPESRPLPQLEPFLEHVKQNLTGNRLLQSRYTFNRHETTQLIDRQGKVKKSWSREWEVFPSVDPRLSYQRLIEKDGQPVESSRIESQDRKHRKRIQKRKQLTPERIEKKHREEKQKEQSQIEELFRLLRFRIQGRERVEGVSTVVATSEPRPGSRPKLKSLRPLRNMRGDAWICEDDYQLVKVEIELTKAVSLAWGAVARLHKGARLRFKRQRVNDEVWLPAESYFLARIIHEGRLIESRAGH